MNSNLAIIAGRMFLALLVLVLGACATPPVSAPVENSTSAEPPAPPVRQTSIDEIPLRAMLAYYATNARQPAVPARERNVQADPYLLMQEAILLGQARTPDLSRASILLENVMKSRNPAAVNLAPLARLLHDQYGERMRIEQQLRDALRRADQLQEKIDALSAIELSLPARPSPVKAPGSAP